MSAPAGLVGRARRAVGRWRTERATPLVTVIVPVYQAEPYLDECLVSLRAQKHDRLQIVVVDDGSTDGSRTIYERHAAVDGRIEVVRQPNRGLGAARNAGIARATGDYLTFLDADDTLPPRAYRVMVEALEESGSDFATGAVHRVTSGRRSVPSWIREVHHEGRRGITIDDYPRAVMDVIACNRMFRLSAWRRMGLAFPEGVAYEDHVPMMTAYARGRFDILRETTYFWRIREDGTSIGQQKHAVGNLRDRLEAKRGARAVLEAEASPAVLAAWQARVLDMDLRLFIDEVPGVDDGYWAVLRDGVREHVERATPQVWADVRVEQRVRAWLVAQDRRPALEALLAHHESGEAVVRARVDGSRVIATVDLPPADQPPPDLLVVGERELALVVGVRSLVVAGDALVIVLALRMGPLDQGLDTAEVTVRLTDEQGRVVTLPTEPADSRVLAQWAQPFVGARWPALRVARVRLSDLEAGRWRLAVRCLLDGMDRTAMPSLRDPDGAAGRPASLAHGADRLVPSWHAATGLTLDRLVAVADPDAPADDAPAADGVPEQRPMLAVDAARLDSAGLELRGRWLGTPPPGDLILEGDGHAALVLTADRDADDVLYRVRWEQPPAPGMWRLRSPGGPAVLWVSTELLGRLPLMCEADALRLAVIRDTDDAPALRVGLRRA
jgi:CDP-glycerol glycerophosphotransferase